MQDPRPPGGDGPGGEEDFARLAALVARKMPLPRLFRGLHGILRGRMSAENMFIARVEGDNLTFPYFVDEKESEDELAVYPMEGLTAALIRSGRRRWLRAEPRFLEENPWVGFLPSDWLGVPVTDRDGEVIGALVVQTYVEGEAYTERDAAFLEVAAILVALAFQLLDFDREIAVRGIAALVEETTELERLYPAMHDIVAGLIPAAAKSFIIARIDRVAGVFNQVYCADERERLNPGPWPVGTGLSGYVSSGEGRAFVFEDGVTPEPEGFRVLGVRPAFWLGAPIRTESGAIIGVVMINTYDPEDAITREDERSLVEVCPHIAHAIARTELLRHARGTLGPGSRESAATAGRRELT